MRGEKEKKKNAWDGNLANKRYKLLSLFALDPSEQSCGMLGKQHEALSSEWPHQWGREQGGPFPGISNLLGLQGEVLWGSKGSPSGPGSSDSQNMDQWPSGVCDNLPLPLELLASNPGELSCKCLSPITRETRQRRTGGSRQCLPRKTSQPCNIPSTFCTEQLGKPRCIQPEVLKCFSVSKFL